MRTSFDIKYATRPECMLDLYLPDQEQFPLLVFFHGGGLETGDKCDNSDLCANLARNGIAAISANYRLYPEAKYPEFITDAAEAVSWIYNHIGEYGKCSKIFIAGSSAGAYLAAMLYLDERYLGAYGIKPTDVAGYIFNAAQPTTHYNILRERGMDTRRVVIDDAAPIYHIEETAGRSQILILVSDHDMPNRLEQTILFHNTLKLFGHNARLRLMEGFEHCAYDNAVDSDGTHILSDIVITFVRGVI